ncbi:hypothetical protein J4464_02050 [Candidatus Woesearchaeota archaeon]|nr:hypothetical protein [Candidatus Woesearchaeota archaeon]
MMMTEPRARVFIKIDDYRDVIDLISLLRSKVKKAKAILDRIHELRSQEENELEGWDQALDEVDRKLSLIDKTLFEPEQM